MTAVAPPLLKAKVTKERYDAIAKALEIGKPWRRIKDELGCSMSTISLISKEMAEFGEDERQTWQVTINEKAMQVMERLIDELNTDDTSRLPADKKAIAYGILHDKVHPKSKDSITVQVAVQQTLDIARNATTVKDI